ncbi:MAG: DNA-processing protein DprA [Candidatus Magasanikbacteria bacterium]
MSHFDASLAHFPKITYSRYRKLTAYFSDLKNLWEAELPEMVAAGLEENIANEFIAWREANPTEKITERMAQEGITTVSLGEPNYPKLLAEITDPPHTLFIRGKLPDSSLPTLAVVGARKFTQYGASSCRQIVEPLARQGMVIVSGLAIGIDGIAHEAALAGQGITVAVLGSGVDHNHIYPATNRELAERIISSGGAVISEYPPGFEATNYSFPARNRIIAGLALGTLVIEAAEESGTLITASCALDYNREVFAIPHTIISSVGIGCNNLIKQGAKMVTVPNDITEALNLKNIQQVVENRQKISASPIEEKIIDILSREPKHVDLIIKETGLNGPSVMSALTLMEMRVMVRNLGGMKYILVG